MPRIIPVTAALLLAAGAAHAQTYVVDHVIIQGLRTVAPSQVQPSLTIRPGSRVTTDQIVADQSNLGRALTQAHVGGSTKASMRTTSPGHIDVIYVVSDAGYQAPTVTKSTAAPVTKDLVLGTLTFEGNKRVPTATLMQAAALRPGTVLTDQVIKDAGARIVAAYASAARFITLGIKDAQTVTPDGHVNLVWQITEKRRKVDTEDEGGQKVDQ